MELLLLSFLKEPFTSPCPCARYPTGCQLLRLTYTKFNEVHKFLNYVPHAYIQKQITGECYANKIARIWLAT